ncbi:hypothetical protein [Magnetofaba australis]|uniref:hypothetical protein n=1 Tax=Magnetofaba australis TaxID=1472297 RepID=UPI001301E707|nr:hypothetical protein [Magnetofaba australis]
MKVCGRGLRFLETVIKAILAAGGGDILVPLLNLDGVDFHPFGEIDQLQFDIKVVL